MGNVFLSISPLIARFTSPSSHRDDPPDRLLLTSIEHNLPEQTRRSIVHMHNGILCSLEGLECLPNEIPSCRCEDLNRHDVVNS